LPTLRHLPAAPILHDPLPRELDEAATIDGASPLRYPLVSDHPTVLCGPCGGLDLPHCLGLERLNFGPLIYLTSKIDSQPISVAPGLVSIYMFGSDPEISRLERSWTIIIPVIVSSWLSASSYRVLSITGVGEMIRVLTLKICP